MRRSRRPRQVDPAAKDLEDWGRQQYIPGASARRPPRFLRGAQARAWGWVYVVIGLMALVLALPGLWEGVSFISNDRGRAVAAVVGTALPLGFSVLMLALGNTLLRRSRRDR